MKTCQPCPANQQYPWVSWEPKLLAYNIHTFACSSSIAVVICLTNLLRADWRWPRLASRGGCCRRRNRLCEQSSSSELFDGLRSAGPAGCLKSSLCGWPLTVRLKLACNYYHHYHFPIALRRMHLQFTQRQMQLVCKESAKCEAICKAILFAMCVCVCVRMRVLILLNYGQLITLFSPWERYTTNHYGSHYYVLPHWPVPSTWQLTN